MEIDEIIQQDVTSPEEVEQLVESTEKSERNELIVVEDVKGQEITLGVVSFVGDDAEDFVSSIEEKIRDGGF